MKSFIQTLTLILTLLFSFMAYAEHQTVERGFRVNDVMEKLESHYGEGVEALEVEMDRMQIRHPDVLIQGLDYKVNVRIDLIQEVLRLNFHFRPDCPQGAMCIVPLITTYIELPIESVRIDYCQGIEFKAIGENKLGEREEIVILDNSYNPCGRKGLFPPTVVNLNTQKVNMESLTGEAQTVHSSFTGKTLHTAK